MSDTNSVVIEGRLTKNAEMKAAGNSSVAVFSIANNQSYKTATGYENKANFFDCECWGKFGEAMYKHLLKGRMLTVTGELIQDSWKDKDGKINSRTKIRVSNMSIRFPPKDQSQATNNPASNPAPDSTSVPGYPADWDTVEEAPHF